MSGAPLTCPLCEGRTKEFGVFYRRGYAECLGCGLVFMKPEFLPTGEQEKSRYLLHENSPANEGYRTYLRQVTDPLKDLLPAKTEGLDFGCGPKPITGLLFESSGTTLSYYDPIFRDDPSVLERTFDFVVCTEVVEHFHKPRAGFQRLRALLKSGGYCGVLTRLLTEEQDFGSWFYPRDFTHTSFYRPETMQWVAENHFCGTVYRKGDAVIFKG